MVLNITKKTEYEIQCSRCKKTTIIRDGSLWYLVASTPEGFFCRQGWREENGKTVCKECFGKGKEK